MPTFAMLFRRLSVAGSLIGGIKVLHVVSGNHGIKFRFCGVNSKVWPWLSHSLHQEMARRVWVMGGVMVDIGPHGLNLDS